MKGWVVAPATVLLAAALAVPAGAAQRKIEPLNQYLVRGGDTAALADLGYDVTEGGSKDGQGIVATPAQAAELRAKGFTVTAPYGERRAAQEAPPNPFVDPPHGHDVFGPWHTEMWFVPIVNLDGYDIPRLPARPAAMRATATRPPGAERAHHASTPAYACANQRASRRSAISSSSRARRSR